MRGCRPRRPSRATRGSADRRGNCYPNTHKSTTKEKTKQKPDAQVHKLRQDDLPLVRRRPRVELRGELVRQRCVVAPEARRVRLQQAARDLPVEVQVREQRGRVPDDRPPEALVAERGRVPPRARVGRPEERGEGARPERGVRRWVERGRHELCAPERGEVEEHDA